MEEEKVIGKTSQKCENDDIIHEKTDTVAKESEKDSIRPKTCVIWEELSREYVRRKTQTWPLHIYTPENHRSHNEADKRKQLRENVRSKTDCLFIGTTYMNEFRFCTDVFDKFVYLRGLLEKYYGKLVVCGGCFTNSDNYGAMKDVDIFFYDCTQEEADDILKGAVGYLVASFYADPDKIYFDDMRDERYSAQIQVERKINVTNVCIYKCYRYNHDGGRYAELCYKYQFIHRIYPTIGHILGGFDLACSAMAYDGVNYLTTDLGKWTFDNKTIIVDISRRSTTFSSRLRKYYMRGFDIVFPGFDVNTVFFDEKRRYESNQPLAERISILRQTMASLGLEFRCTGGMDYEGCWSSTTFESHVQSRYKDDYVCKDIVLQRPRTEDVPPEKMHFQPDTPKKATEPEKYREKYSDYGDWVFLLDNEIRANNTSCLLNGKLECIGDIITYEDIVKNCSVDNTEKKIDGIELISSFSLDKFLELFEKRRQNPVIIYFPSISSMEDRYTHRYYPFRLFGPYANELPSDFVDCLYRHEGELKCRRYKDIFAELVPKCDTLISHSVDICMDRLKGTSWMVQHPQRQWTATVNPEVLCGKDFYGEKYTPFYAVLRPEVETLLRCARKFPEKGGFIGWLQRDILILIIRLIPFV